LARRCGGLFDCDNATTKKTLPVGEVHKKIIRSGGKNSESRVWGNRRKGILIGKEEN